jgi:hypothetical protein
LPPRRSSALDRIAFASFCLSDAILLANTALALNRPFTAGSLRPA